MYAVVAKAGRATFHPGLSATVSGFHLLRGREHESTFVDQPIGTLVFEKLRSVCQGPHFLKPEYRAKKRCKKSSVFLEH